MPAIVKNVSATKNVSVRRCRLLINGVRKNAYVVTRHNVYDVMIVVGAAMHDRAIEVI